MPDALPISYDVAAVLTTLDGANYTLVQKLESARDLAVTLEQELAATDELLSKCHEALQRLGTTWSGDTALVDAVTLWRNRASWSDPGD